MGILPGRRSPSLGLIVFPAFVVQLVVAYFCFWGRDTIAGTLMLGFATTWLVEALVFYKAPTGGKDTLGIFLIVFAVFAALILVIVLSARGKPAQVAVLIVVVPRFLIAGIAEVTASASTAKAAAVLGFLLAAVALYAAFTALLADPGDKEILPIGQSQPARHPADGNLAPQLRNIERQAGVRRTL